MIVKNIHDGDWGTTINGKKYLFDKDEIKKVPDFFRGMFTDRLLEVREIEIDSGDPRVAIERTTPQQVELIREKIVIPDNFELPLVLEATPKKTSKLKIITINEDKEDKEDKPKPKRKRGRPAKRRKSAKKKAIKK